MRRHRRVFIFGNLIGIFHKHSVEIISVGYFRLHSDFSVRLSSVRLMVVAVPHLLKHPKKWKFFEVTMFKPNDSVTSEFILFTHVLFLALTHGKSRRTVYVGQPP